VTDVQSLSVVLPVLDERQSLDALLERFDSLRDQIGLEELIFVDDGSRDGTLEILQNSSSLNHGYEIRTIPRHKKMGQVDACITGCRAATSRLVVVMDADLQHPPEAIPSMLSALREGCDIVIGSRYVNGARIRRRPERGVISRGAMVLAHILLPISNRIRDPMSGFFLARKSLITDLKLLRGRCKLLLFILAVHRDARVAEVGYEFQERSRGHSKTVAADFSFVPRFLIEVMTYMKVRSSSDPRFVSDNKLAGALTRDLSIAE
jgi:dolichol-phosphate mannosyltransferase